MSIQSRFANSSIRPRVSQTRRLRLSAPRRKRPTGIRGATNCRTRLTFVEAVSEPFIDEQFDELGCEVSALLKIANQV